MSTDTLFSIANSSVLPIWLLLALAPGWKVTHWIVGSCAVPLALAALYLVLIATNLNGAEGDFGSLDGIAKLFADREVLLAGWVHYLVFDLFIGTWEVRDARRIGVPHLVVVPCLFLTLMLGPVGLLAYFVCRWVRGEYFLSFERGGAAA
ncbi:MAG: DUF4281 domain-containing protein [Pirellulales bacterium]|nr:DUF4281 domain-containing protein [Pirellulales bacterium]